MKLLHSVSLAAMMALFGLTLGLCTPSRAQAPSPEPATLVLAHGRIYFSPDMPPLENGSIVVRAGRIAAIEAGSAISPQPGSRVIDCTGLAITAGFQNSHVHFTEAKWSGAAGQPAAKLESQLAEMLTRYGFTTAVDTGSDPRNTIALRSRVETGELAGPRILTAGGALYPPDGIPFYLKEALPAAILPLLDTPATPEEAARIVQRDISGGVDIIKIFTGSLVTRTSVKTMSPDVARAVVQEAHRGGRLVFSHPSNLAGIQVALDAGVDVLAHTASDGRPWSEALVAEMTDHHTSLIPTLKLWTYELSRAGAAKERLDQVVNAAAQQLAAFSKAGGQILFGTDVGYMTDYDPTDEYALMAGPAGLTPMQILASLTTAPAARFNESARRGRLAAGMDADLVILAADPAGDARRFSDVRYTIRGGRIIYPVPHK